MSPHHAPRTTTWGRATRAGWCTAAAAAVYSAGVAIPAGADRLPLLGGLLLACSWAAAGLAGRARRRSRDTTLTALRHAILRKDAYTQAHCQRVGDGAAMLARQLGMPHDRVEAVRRAGMLHDVGKLCVPVTVLCKAGPLTDTERDVIRRHPVRGQQIVARIGFLSEAATGVAGHHERVDGRGYPLGLAGDAIPEAARIVAIADTFDAMTSTRTYSKPRPAAVAVAELRKHAGTQFDAVLVDAFTVALRREGWPDAGDPQLPPPVISHDHDDPASPLRMGGLVSCGAAAGGAAALAVATAAAAGPGVLAVLAIPALVAAVTARRYAAIRADCVQTGWALDAAAQDGVTVPWFDRHPDVTGSPVPARIRSLARVVAPNRGRA